MGIETALGLASAYGAIKGGGDTTTSSTTIDPQSQARYDDLYNKAKGIASQPFVPYTGARVAGFNPDQLQGFDATRNMFGQSMSFDPRNRLNQLSYQPAPSVNLPFGYGQPNQPQPQPTPMPGGTPGVRPPQPPSIGGIGGGRPDMLGNIGNTRIGNYDLERQTRGLQLQATPAPGNTNNFGGVDLGGTPSSSILGDFVPPPGYREGKDEGGPATGPTFSSDPFRKKGFSNQTPTQGNPFAPTQLRPAAMQQAANIAPVDLYKGASVNRGDVRDVTPQSLLSTDLGAYQNPFQSQVIDNTLGDLNKARQLQIQSDQDAAIGRGAFGGSRSALLESETNRKFAEQAAKASGNLRSQGFDRATSLAGQDIGRQFDADRYMSDTDRAIAMQNATFGQQAGLARQGLLGDVAQNQAQLDARRFGADQSALNQFGLQQGQFNNQMNMGMFDAANRAAFMQPGLEMQNRQFQANLLENQVSDQYKNLGLLSGIGLQQQGLQQRGMDAGYNEFMRALNYGPQQLGLLSNAVFGIPQSTTTTGNTDQGDMGRIGGLINSLGTLGLIG